MKTTITIIALLFGLSLSAQTFERTIALNGNEHAPYNLVEVNGFYYVLIYQINDSLSVLYQLDSLGGVNDSLSLNNHYSHVNYLNNKIYLFGGFGGNLSANGSAISIAVINPFNLTIEKVVLTKLNNLMAQYYHGSVKYFDNCICFTIVGGGKDTSGYARGSVIQLDTANLNILKEAQYTHWTGSSQNIHTAFKFYDIFESPDINNYWALTDSPLDTTIWESGIANIIPINSKNLAQDTINNKLLFDVNNPSPVANGGYHGLLSNRPVSGFQLTDTTFIFVGGTYLTKGTVNTTFWGEQDMGFVITDDSLNDIRWEFWGGQKGSAIVGPDSTELPAVGAGVSKFGDYAYIAYTTDFVFFYGSTNPFTLRKVDLQGNEIWTKHYAPSLSYAVYSVLATSDGGALVSGQIFGPSTAAEKNIYVLKVDSSGNLLTTSTRNQLGEIPINNFKIYPNPAKNELNLLKLNQFKAYNFELYDTYGRLVKTVEWREDHQTVDVSSLASGMYVYQIIDEEGNVGSGMLMVE